MTYVQVPFDAVKFRNGVPHSHPLFAAEKFVPHPITVSPYKLNLTVHGIVKLLMYGDFLKARSMATNKPMKELLKAEVAKYPYSLKSTLKVRQTVSLS